MGYRNFLLGPQDSIQVTTEYHDLSLDEFNYGNRKALKQHITMLKFYNILLVMLLWFSLNLKIVYLIHLSYEKQS